MNDQIMDEANPALLAKIQVLLQYNFKNESLLIEALTTPAFGRQHGVKYYERLEFLGDSILKMILTTTLFDMDLEDPEELTKTRAILESNKVLATQAAYLGLHEFARSLSPIEVTDIGILSDIFEALCGAIYLDSGKDMNVVKRVLVSDLIHKLHDFADGSPDQYKNFLLEAIQKIYGLTPLVKMDYVESGPDHDKRFGARNISVIDPETGETVKFFHVKTIHDNFKKKKDAEKDIMKRAYDAWREENFKP
ncbi:MAG: ribonuclease III domain-containing protein [Promethearchaeota archaeon]